MRLTRLVLSVTAAVLLFGANNSQAQPSSVPGNVTSPPSAEPPLSEEKRADILMARKMYREAIEKYQAIEPQTAVIANKTGIAYHQMMQLDRAKKHYERSIKMDRRYAEAINNVGTVHYARKSFRRAVSFYKRALKITPNSASIHSNLGTAEFARKRYKEAVEAYQRALSLDSDIFEHRSTYGTILQERTVEEKAKFHYYLAKTYAQAGYKDRALQYLRKALEEGFKDKQKMAEEPDFAAFRESPEFQELLTLQPRVL
ncbi:MAG: tetratricopeptide repeat protein [Bryobacteraceae bacterium]